MYDNDIDSNKDNDEDDGDGNDFDKDNDDDDGDDEDGSLGRTVILTVHSSATGSHSTTLGLDLLNIFCQIMIYSSIFPYILIHSATIRFGSF